MIDKIFQEMGGEFLCPFSVFKEKLQRIKAFVFDWDGVFNDARKFSNAESSFSEVDSMGLNILRFGFWLYHNQEMPKIAVISGVANEAAIYMAKREHFDGIYMGYKHKIDALHDFAAKHDLEMEEIAFTFDDILDLSAVKAAGLRFQVKRACNPLFNSYILNNQFCEYTSGNTGSNNVIREICELNLGSIDMYDNAVDQRVEYGENYQKYIAERNYIKTEMHKNE